MPSIFLLSTAKTCAPCPCRCARLTLNGCWHAGQTAGEIGPDLFRAACNMGLEGLVSKRRDRPYRGGRSKDWVKVKNRSHPAMERVKESFL
jgi:bifunctional non-homologous end joining protein LigD